MFDKEACIAELRDHLGKMKEIANWENDGRAILAFPPPDAESYIIQANKVLDIIDNLMPLNRPSSNLGNIAALNSIARQYKASGNNEVYLQKCQETTELMNEFIVNIENSIPDIKSRQENSI